MKFSIITINYNNDKGLRKTIESIVKQNKSNFEYIVIDGASTDESSEIIKEYNSYISLWISEKDNGIYDAINKGISRASGDYLMFLNSGDTLTDNTVLDRCQSYLNEFPEVDILYGDIYTLENNVQGIWHHPEELTISFFKNNNINHQASLVKASLFNQFGLYPEKYKLAGDHWLFLISFLNDKQFKHINYPLVIYDKSGVSTQKRSTYEKEVEEMWDELVPGYVDELVRDFKEVEYAKKYKFLKLVVPLHHAITYHKRTILIVLIILAIIVSFLLLLI